MARKRLGELLLERKIIAPPQLDQALAYQRQTGHRLGAALVALGFLTENQLCEALAQALGMKAAQLPPAEIDWAALHSLRSRFCEANDLFPLALDQTNPNRKTLVVAMADPLNIPAIEEMEFTTGLKVVAMIAPLSAIRQTIRHYYQKEAGQPGDKAVARPKAEPAPVAPVKQPLRPPRPPGAMSLTEENELPVLADNELVDYHEVRQTHDVTERTALADLIKARADQQRRKKKDADGRSVDSDLAYLFGVKSESPSDEMAKLETKLWALLRIMAKKGLITREEFLKEIADKDE